MRAEDSPPRGGAAPQAASEPACWGEAPAGRCWSWGVGWAGAGRGAPRWPAHVRTPRAARTWGLRANQAARAFDLRANGAKCSGSGTAPPPGCPRGAEWECSQCRKIGWGGHVAHQQGAAAHRGPTLRSASREQRSVPVCKRVRDAGEGARARKRRRISTEKQRLCKEK